MKNNKSEYQGLQRILYFIEFFKDGICTKREKRWKTKVSYFLFLSCLLEEGMLTRSNLYPAAGGENSRIWTCGCLDLLPSLLLFSTYHSIVRANCLIISFCLYPKEFKVPTNSP